MSDDRDGNTVNGNNGWVMAMSIGKRYLAAPEQVGQGERGDRVDGLARHVESLAAGREQPQPRAPAQERPGQRGAGADQVLAVV